MTHTPDPEMIVVGGRVFTADPDLPWCEAFAVAGGAVQAVGTEQEIRSLAGERTEILDVGGRLVLPGLTDGHIHLGLGGGQTAWELPILPSDSREEIFAKVRDWAAKLGPGEWVVGGIVGTEVLDLVTAENSLAGLDEASLGHPVLLRDLSMHNRWVNSEALALMGIDADSADPDGGAYVRDADGALTGVLYELACAEAEDAFQRSIADPAARNRISLKQAMQTINSYGITSVQDGATMAYAWEALAALDDDGEMTAWVAGSMPTRPFIEEGVVGEELYAYAADRRRRHLRPDYLKFVLDGVPITRTSAMLSPYRCHHAGDDPAFQGDPYWTLDELVAGIEYCYDHGFGGKLHATGNAAARLVLDAIERVQRERGPGPVFQMAHPEFIDPADIARFGELGVVVDASPYLWYPGPITESIKLQVDAELVDVSFPLKSLADAGAVVAAGSDWPCVLPEPDPWVGLETMVTRANVDPSIEGRLAPAEAMPVEEAILAFTRNPSIAAGLDEVSGTLTPGLSADFIVLDRDIFRVDPREIHLTKVEATYFEGRPVYERNER